jgi:hypothetical protein
LFVIENTNPDPFHGSFTFKGQLHDVTNKWAIDGTVFEHPPGQLYSIWSGWEGDVNVRQILYIAKMSDPWTISSERVEIARPIYNWETNNFPYINEGPEVTIRNDVISLVYSASGSWTNDYCLGLITASTTSDLMNPASWKKHPEPIFKSANNVLAPGHHSLTKSPDGQEDWIIYHSARFSGSGWTRQIRAQKFTWNADSTPNLGEPEDRNIPIQLPSGDPIRDRYEAEDARLINNPRAVPDDTASNKIKVGYIDYPNSTVIFTIQCAKAGTYVIVIRDGNGTEGGPLATHWLTINNGSQIEIPVVYSRWDMWGASMIRANLTQGVNTLTFKKGNNFAELDEIDIFLDA